MASCSLIGSPCPHTARSLGSVALRKAENLEGGLHLNVFTVDFNEELVALYGGSLTRQTHFLHESIKAILRLYKVNPTEVPLQPRASLALVSTLWEQHGAGVTQERSSSGSERPAGRSGKTSRSSSSEPPEHTGDMVVDASCCGRLVRVDQRWR